MLVISRLVLYIPPPSLITILFFHIDHFILPLEFHHLLRIRKTCSVTFIETLTESTWHPHESQCTIKAKMNTPTLYKHTRVSFMIGLYQYLVGSTYPHMHSLALPPVYLSLCLFVSFCLCLSVCLYSSIVTYLFSIFCTVLKMSLHMGV